MSKEKQCLENKKNLQVYLEREELGIIDDLKKDTPIVAVNPNPNPDPQALNQLDIVYAIHCIFSRFFFKFIHLFPIILIFREKPPKIQRSNVISIAKYGCVPFILLLFLAIPYLMGIISGITGEPFPFSSIFNWNPKIYY